MKEVDSAGLVIVSLNIEIIVRRNKNVVKQGHRCEIEADVLLVYL